MLEAKNLKTEYMKDPMGIDTACQHLSWMDACAEPEESIKDGQTSDPAMQMQAAYQIAFSVNEGQWQELETVPSASMHYRLDAKLGSRDRVAWKVRLTDGRGQVGPWSGEAHYEMAVTDLSEASWLTGNYDHSPEAEVRYPVDCFQKVCRLDIGAKIIRARLYMTALGIYETHINGQRVGDFILAPGCTNYEKRSQVQTYDVTEQIKQAAAESADGRFTWTIDLADGWYVGKTGVFSKTKTFGYEPKVIGLMEVYFADGSCRKFATDADFSWSNDGPVTASDMKDGEVVDLRKKPSYSGRAKVAPCDIITCASNNVPIREEETFANPKVLTTPDGHTVLDFGQNISGYMSASVEGPAGHACSMVFGEKLTPEGNFTVENISYQGEYDKNHFQRNDLICDGNRHVYKPRFTFMGFRYALLLDWPEEVRPEHFTACAVYSDMETTFAFDSSDAGLNQIVKNTFWSVKGNFCDIPTDCPTRERAGWTGDAQLFFNTGNYMMDQRAFFRKWLRDVADGQKANGLVYNINPMAHHDSEMIENYSMEGSAGWGDAMIFIPYYFWKRYGDDCLIRENWESMKKCYGFYLSRMGKREALSLTKPKRGPLDKYLCMTGRNFGEWTEPDDCRPPMASLAIPMTEEATAYLSYDAELMAEIGTHLMTVPEFAGPELEGLIAGYKNISEKTKEAYDHYFVKDGKIKTKRICKFVRPVGLGLVQGEKRQKLLDRIVEMNRQRRYRIGTGFLSTPFVFEALQEAGQADDAYRMLMNPELGWMQQVNRGATTVWENWTDDASLNHYSKGACCQWVFDGICGIRLDGRENRFIIEPHPIGALDHITLAYDSAYGRVASEWKRTQNADGREVITYTVSVPDNCTAELTIPGEKKIELNPGQYSYEK